MPLPVTATLAAGATILTVALALNSLLLTGLRRDKSLRAVTYYYANSVCAAMLLQCLVAVPPDVVFGIVGEKYKPLLDTLCIIWLYMDTFLCNLVFLHCLGCAIDTWLRLRYPMSYSHSTGRGSTCLKISAPWCVSFIQTTAEFAVSKQYEELYDAAGGACLHRDPNFVILRACMSYGLPGLASLALLLLAFRQFAVLRRSDGNADAATSGLMEAAVASRQRRRRPQGRGLEQQQMEYQQQQQQHDQPSVIEMHRDCTAETLLLHPMDTATALTLDSGGGSGVLLEMYRMATIPEAHDETMAASGAPASSQIVGSRSCQALGGGTTALHNRSQSFGESDGANSNSNWWLRNQRAQASLPISYTTDRLALHRLARDCAICPRHGRRVASFESALAEEQQQQQQQQQDVTPTMSTGAAEPGSEIDIGSGSGQWERIREARSNSWRRMLQEERAACTINLCLFFVATVFWSPYMLGSLAHCLCLNFRCDQGAQLSARTLADAKWIAYAACLAYPLFFLAADKRLRLAAWRVATCSDVEAPAVEDNREETAAETGDEAGGEDDDYYEDEQDEEESRHELTAAR